MELMNKKSPNLTINCTCMGCGVVFIPKSKAHIKYCNPQCRNNAVKIKDKNCDYCNKIYTPISGRKNNFCGRICYDLFKGKQGDIGKKQPPKGTIINCKQCSISFSPPKNESKYCSVPCQRLSLRREGVTTERRASWKKFSDKYQSRKRAVMIDKITLAELIKRDSSICHICNGMTSCKYSKNNKYSPTVDHVKPLTKGGLHSWDNVKLAHLSCNSRKRNKHNG